MLPMGRSPPAVKSAELAPGIRLENRDVTDARGVVCAVEYWLGVDKDKIVVFDLDLSGSTNIALDGALALRKRTSVQPRSRSLVGVARVLEPAKGWGLETRYSWREESPGTLQPGASKTERLSEGVALITSRLLGLVDGFDMEIQNSNSSALNITADVSRCVNLALTSGGSAVTVSVPPYGRVSVGTLQVVDSSKGYTFVPRFIWNDGISAIMSSKDASPFGTRSPNEARAPVTPPLLSFNSSRPTLKQPKREEISPSVFLVTETSDTRPVEIVYFLEVHKATQVVFDVDFTGSINMELVDGGLKRSTKIAPFGKAQVARLRAINADQPWKLVCRYVWEEEDVDQVARPSSFQQQQQQPGHGLGNSLPSTLNLHMSSPSKPKHAPRGSVRSFLAALGLDAFADTFEREELTVDLLKIMSHDEAEFRRAMQQLGMSKMGQREKLLLAIKNLS